MPPCCLLPTLHLRPCCAQGGSELRLDFSNLLGPLFFCWLLQLLLPLQLYQLGERPPPPPAACGDWRSRLAPRCRLTPVVTRADRPSNADRAPCAAVYEKERGLRRMMKMHGLGDWAYWAIQVGG